MSPTSLDDADRLIREAMRPLPSEDCPLDDGAGRTLAVPVVARHTHPAAAVSAMDGYAVALAGARDAGTSLTVIGEAPAGRPFAGQVATGEAVRIFTGGVVPGGADHIVIQEDTAREGDTVTLTEAQDGPSHIRPAGGDFTQGDDILPAGRPLSAIDLALAAQAGVPTLSVHRRPKVAIFANGDELREPGEALGPGEVTNSIRFALLPLCRAWGAEVRYLGCAADSEEAVAAMFEAAGDADLVVPIGGASVGDYDFVKRVGRDRFALAFEKVAVKPGKPVWFGTGSGGAVLGLPGNPASAIACAHLFLHAAIASLQGRAVPLTDRLRPALLDAAVRSNGPRTQFMRATHHTDAKGQVRATPLEQQDTALLSPFAAATCLLFRPAGDPARDRGDIARILPL